ncbi:MAG: S8 family peptidase [Candidatus Bruticola sp.]
MINSIGSAYISNLQPGSTATIAKAQPPQEETVYCQASQADQVDIRPQTKLEKALAASSTKAAQLEQDLEPHVPGQVIVKTKGTLMQSTSNIAQKYGAVVLEKFNNKASIFKGMQGEMLHMQLPEGMTTAQALAVMQEDPEIEYAVPNSIYTLEDEVPSEAGTTSAKLSTSEGKVPNDLDSKLWGLKNDGQDGGTPGVDIGATQAWQKTTGLPNGQGPIIAVIDTGVDYNHPDLVNNIWTNPGEIPGNGIDDDGNGVVDDVHGYNAFSDNGDPMDVHSHGTHCAGTIAAEGNNGQGVVGVNWQATVMPVKIFDDNGRTNAAAIIRGINYASNNGARITSNSWGGGEANLAIRDAFAHSKALHIMAAGNSADNNDQVPHYPGSYPLHNSITVAATDRNDKLAKFSCYGKESVHIAAPGKDIYSTVPGGGYASKSGTSMATPHVSGAAGLLLAMDPTMSNDELKTRLLEGSDKIDGLQNVVSSGGRLNVNKAMEYEYHIAQQ